MVSSKKKKAFLCLFVIIFFIIIYFNTIMTGIGNFLIADEKPVLSDAVIVLNTGVDIYPRLLQAADIYNEGLAKKIIINGNRKTRVLRDLEIEGFKSCCPWYEDRMRILELKGVKREDIIAVSIENAYDTISEAKGLGNGLSDKGMTRIIVTTSKFHTRRAKHIWNNLYQRELTLLFVSAKTDPYSPEGWWKDGRQFRWVLSEYGAWLYYFWKTTKRDIQNT